MSTFLIGLELEHWPLNPICDALLEHQSQSLSGKMGQNQPIELSEEEKKELSIGLLRDWWVASTQALVDTASSEIALRFLEPHCMNAGKASAYVFPSITGIIELREMKNAQGNILAKMMDGVWGAGYVADDESFIGELFDCATEGSCKEACEALCSIQNLHSVEEKDPSYTSILTRSLSRGDKSCQWLVSKKGKPPKVQPSKEFLPPHLMVKPESIPSEQAMNSLAHAYLGEFWVISTKAFVEQSGSEKALDRLSFYMRHSGMSLGIRLADHLNAHQRKMDSVVDLVALIQVLHQRRCEVTRDKSSIECEIMECPFSSSPPEVCHQYQAFFNGICEAIDPSYEFIYDRMMTKGDKTCHWTIRKKGEVTKEKTKEERASDDPIRMLTSMYIKGEITEEEFRKKMAVLKEFKL